VAAQITNQSFYKLYSKLSGMTGTAKTEVILLSQEINLFPLMGILADASFLF
jgi:preprotein translocase subunit SecA